MSYDNFNPVNFNLYPNYPNPFNPATKISFSIDRPSKVLLQIYDVKGEFISTLMNGEYTTGTYETPWNADKYSSGVYFVKLSDGNSLLTQKLMLIK